MIDGKRVRIFINEFKYEGELISEDSETYTITDMKFGKVRLPKSASVVVFLDREGV